MMKKNQSGWSRRKFIVAATGAGAAIMLNPFSSWAIEEIDPRVAAIVATTIGVDTHNHIDVPINKTDLPGPGTDMSGDMKKSGLSAICMTFAVDYQQLVNPGDGYLRFINGLDAMDNMLQKNDIRRSLNLKDIADAHKNHQPTVIQSVEGGHFLEGKLDRLGIAYSRGLRHLGLLHDNDAAVPLGDVFTNTAQWGGLTSFGADTVKECNQLGILVDLAHASNETVDMVLKVSKLPVLASHTGLDTRLGQNPSMAKMMRPRLISKERAKIIADAGGVIGVWTHLSDTALEYAQNISALVDVAGIDHVCIGTDTKLTPSYRSPNDKGFEPHAGGPPPGTGKPGDHPDNHSHDDNKPNGSGGGQNRKRAGERTNEAWEGQKDGFYYAVVDAMLKTGFNEDEIAKIGGGNFCRVFDAATRGH